MNVHTAPSDAITLINDNPIAAFTDEVAYSEFYAKVKAEVAAHVPDLSTDRGRKEIASLAYKVTRSKTAIDAAGKKLNEDARAQINKVDAQRRKIRDELDALAAEVRKPLTDWEEAEKKRQEVIEAAFDELHTVIQFPAPAGASAECILDRIGEIEAETFDPAVFGDRLVDIEALRAQALAAVRAAHDRQRQHEDDQAELARLRAEQEERERGEREAREKAEADRLAIERADQLADQIIDYIKQVRAGTIGGQTYPYGILLRELEIKIPLDDFAPRHHARIAEAKREAHEFLTAQMERDAAQAAEREAANQKAIEQAAADQARADERRKAEEAVKRAEAEAKAIRDKAEREERERQEAIERTRREEEARAADREHRGKIMAAAKEGLKTVGCGEAVAKKIVLAIVAGEIPNVTLKF